MTRQRCQNTRMGHKGVAVEHTLWDNLSGVLTAPGLERGGLVRSQSCITWRGGQEVNLTVYPGVEEFLRDTRAFLEQDEVVNGLLLGHALRVQRSPEILKGRPYFAVVSGSWGPVLAAGMIPPRRLILCPGRRRWGRGLELLARNLSSQGWLVPGVVGPGGVADEFAAVWSRVTGRGCKESSDQRLYVLRDVVAPGDAPGRLCTATEAVLDLLAEWICAFSMEVLASADVVRAAELARYKFRNQELYTWEDGQTVSMVSRGRPTTNGISVGLVYTPPPYRGRGYATSCVAALSQLLLDLGYHHCTLFADLANSTPNDIYQRIGYRPVCDFREVAFDVQPALPLPLRPRFSRWSL